MHRFTSGALALQKACCRVNDIGNRLSSMTPYDPMNWMLLTTETYSTTENILKINVPWKNGLATGCNPKAEYTAWGPVHTKAWSRECTFPARGSGKAQLEDDTDLRIRGRIWTGYDFYPPQTDKSLVHPSVLQLEDKVGLFTPDRSEQNESCLPIAKQSSDARPQRESHLCLTTSLEGLSMADTGICFSSFTINQILPSWVFCGLFFFYPDRQQSSLLWLLVTECQKGYIRAQSKTALHR